MAAPASAGSSASSALLELSGSYYDPRSSRPLRALLRVDAERRVLVTANGVDVACAAAELRFSAPLLGATLTALRLPTGAALETADAAAVARLRELSGRPTSFGRIHRWERSNAVVALAAILTLATLLAGYLWLIPLGASQVARLFPVVSQQIGKGTLGLLDALLLEPSRLAASDQQRLREHFEGLRADYPGVRLQLEFRSARVANAFALSDGTVVLTDELVALAGHDDQVIAVLLHEIGHVVFGHGLRRALRSSAFLVLMMSYYGDVAQLTAVAGSLPISYAQSRYSRQEEEEADGMALEGLRRHGKDPVCFARILRALVSEPGPERPELKYFSSHPAVAERAARFERAR
jgi:Zn-dependent protease with chaperone function